WAEVARRLSAWGSVVITGGNAPAELAHIRAIQAAFPAAASFAGQTSLCELAAIIRGATLFCGCDSAALHLAEAMGTPILALFGPTNPFHWQPRLTPHRILRAGGSPPWQPGTPGGSLAKIAAAEALEALEDLAASSVRISLQPSGKTGVQSL
ncbi:MAG: hypothetical protein N2322_06000, partial [Terrimicrobiaceae bacterium]|nr:hypothetical protein [Terrimicrobiaceae bacterium]